MTEQSNPPEIRRGLSRGLAALLQTSGQENHEPKTVHRNARTVPIQLLKPNPHNPRKRFDEADIDALAASIKRHGVIQPILVRALPSVSGAFEIVAGERRWRGAQRAAQHQIPIILIEATDCQALEIGIVENVQRTDLNPLEEAAGYARLTSEYGYTHVDLAGIVGKSRSHIANTLRLLNLTGHARSLLEAGKISAGHGRALLGIAQSEMVARRIVAEGLSVREVERIGQKSAGLAKRRNKFAPDTLALEQKLRLALGTTVTIHRLSGESGVLRIEFRTLEQLDDYCARLFQNP